MTRHRNRLGIYDWKEAGATPVNHCVELDLGKCKTF